tara:strand:+ start:103 stop:345 length:243 start_codon:yes stop_codon:yes gene_type:complete
MWPIRPFGLPSLDGPVSVALSRPEGIIFDALHDAPKVRQNVSGTSSSVYKRKDMGLSAVMASPAALLSDPWYVSVMGAWS